ncbi:MAG: hypothetical protein MJB14_10725, partial [Spirochaetes bacterium]|nr:hypothetical protein [Spirochaetota bacterium]
IKSYHCFITSIRNPWDWYLSLWTYGVQGSGGVRQRLTKSFSESLNKLIKSKQIHDFKHFLVYELFKDRKKWQNLYSDNKDVHSFRKWLKLIHNSRNSIYLGEGYSTTNITHLCGLMTYRYFNLCCKNTELLRTNKISTYHDLVDFDNKNCYIHYFIKLESLEESLIEILNKIRPLKPEEKTLIMKAKKTNTSKRPLSISDYYDDESIDLVEKKDRLIIEKFGYSFPR